MEKGNRETKSFIEPLVDFDVPVEDRSQNIIKVIGVGGGGCNAVSNMYEEGIQGVTFAACNTDSKQLSKVAVPVKLLLGKSGLGCGANPELGRAEAESSIDDIEHLLNDGTQMVFVTSGMGGGTGTGAAPVVAGVAKKLGLLTVGVVTIPFSFEKKRKIIKALRGVDELRKNVDALLIVNNERLCDVYGDSDVPMKEAFKRADNILKDGVKGIAELITVHSDGGIDLDFRDVETTMRGGGGAIMAMGRAKGQFRVENAIMNALDSPLLYGSDIAKAKRILFNIYASDDAPIFVREMQEIDDFFDLLDPNIEVIWGTSTDDSLGEDVKVTILATGMEDDIRTDNRPKSCNEDDDEFYEELIPKLYKPVKKAVRQIANRPGTTNETTQDTGQDAANHGEQQPVVMAQTPTTQDSTPQEPDKQTATAAPRPVIATIATPDHASEATAPEAGTNDETNETTDRTPDEAAASDERPKPGQPTLLSSWRQWLRTKANEMLNEPDD